MYEIKSDIELDKVRKEFFTHDFRPKYEIFNGFTMAEYFSEVWEEIDAMEVYEDDIWVTGYPKSGTTWTRELVWCMENNLDFAKAADIRLPYRFPFLEFCSIFHFKTENTETSSNIIFPSFCDSVKYIKDVPRPRYILTHLPWDLLPKQIRTYQKRPKIIHIARNPKDTCVSYFHHCKLTEGYTGTFEDFWQLFIRDKLNWTPYWKNILSYWNRRSESNVLFIKYEDMKKDLIQIIRILSEFLSKRLSPEQTQILYSHINFEAMKKTKSLNFQPVVEFLKQFQLCKNESGYFKRADLIGNYRAQMCADVNDIFDNWIEENTKDTQLELKINK